MDKIMEQIVTALKPFFDRIDAKFEHMDARFDDIEKDLANTKDVLGRVSGKVDVIQHDISEIKGTLGEVRERSGRHAEVLLDHDQRLRRLEEHRA